MAHISNTMFEQLCSSLETEQTVGRSLREGEPAIVDVEDDVADKMPYANRDYAMRQRFRIIPFISSWNQEDAIVFVNINKSEAVAREPL